MPLVPARVSDDPLSRLIAKRSVREIDGGGDVDDVVGVLRRIGAADVYRSR